MSKSNFI